MALDMLVVTTFGRSIMGTIAALMLGFISWLMWTVSFPPLTGLSLQTFSLVNTLATMMAIVTILAWYKLQAEGRVRLIAAALIIVGAFAGAWIGYEYGFNKGIDAVKALYFGEIPGGEIRVPTQSGIRWSVGIGALSANGMGLAYHVYRLFRFRDPADF